MPGSYILDSMGRMFCNRLRELYLSHFLGQTLVYASNICQRCGSCFIFFLFTLRRAQNILRNRLPRYMFLWLDFCCKVKSQEVFLFFLMYSFLSCFFHLRSLDYIGFLYSLLFVVFFFIKYSNALSLFDSSINLLIDFFCISLVHFSIPNCILIS